MSAPSNSLARLVYQELRACGIRHMVGVPDRETAALWQCFVEDKDAKVITACREGEAVGICAGLHLMGHQPLYCVKNFGFFESLDTFRVLAVDLRTPLLMFIGYAGRARPGFEEELRARMGDATSQIMLAGQWTEKILRAIDVPHYTIDTPDDVQFVRRAVQQANAESRPVALLGEMP